MPDGAGRARQVLDSRFEFGMLFFLTAVRGAKHCGEFGVCHEAPVLTWYWTRKEPLGAGCHWEMFPLQL